MEEWRFGLKLKGESWKAQNAQKEKESPTQKRECFKQIGPFYVFIIKPINVMHELT